MYLLGHNQSRWSRLKLIQPSNKNQIRFDKNYNRIWAHDNRTIRIRLTLVYYPAERLSAGELLIFPRWYFWVGCFNIMGPVGRVPLDINLRSLDKNVNKRWDKSNSACKRGAVAAARSTSPHRELKFTNE